MTPGYDMERVRVAVQDLRAALDALKAHQLHWSVRWRVDRLRREAIEFISGIWQNTENTQEDNR